jgi:hypothetical protein
VKGVNRPKYSPQKPERSRTIHLAGHAPGAYPLGLRATVVLSKCALPSLIAYLLTVLPEIDANDAGGVLVEALLEVVVTTLQALDLMVGDDPGGCGTGVLQGPGRCRRTGIGLCRELVETDGARDTAREQEKALHRDCPRRSATEGYHVHPRRQHGRFDAAGRPQ